MEINKEDIELINSFGPFNHSVWRKNEMAVTHEEVLAGRADFLVAEIRKIIIQNFTNSEIKQMSIVDIGCYDGYILQQLSDLPFKKMVGIEPRQKNIDKGKSIRKILGIKEKVQFKKNTLEGLANQQFDIVLCIGVLHHVESISTAIRKLDSLCKKILILENLCIPSQHITDSFKVDIEMKDLIYKTETLCGLTGQKFESSYYDGSAASSTVVSIPTIETMMMHLSSLGHTRFAIAASPDDFSKAMKKNTRPSREVLIYSIKEKKKRNTVNNAILDYESGLMNTYIPSDVINPLYQRYLLKKKIPATKELLVKMIEYIEGGSISGVEKSGANGYTLEILKNMKFYTEDKVAFEFSKTRYTEGAFDEAIEVLENIVQKLNSDWRTCYRSFYLLAQINKGLKNTAKFNKYIKLCKNCNPDYPLLAKNKLGLKK